MSSLVLKTNKSRKQLTSKNQLHSQLPAFYLPTHFHVLVVIPEVYRLKVHDRPLGLSRWWEHSATKITNSAEMRTSINREIYADNSEYSEPYCQGLPLNEQAVSMSDDWRKSGLWLTPPNHPETVFVNPRTSVATAHKTDPSNMYGLRLPKREVELSASMPKSIFKTIFNRKARVEWSYRLTVGRWVHLTDLPRRPLTSTISKAPRIVGMAMLNGELELFMAVLYWWEKLTVSHFSAPDHLYPKQSNRQVWHFSPRRS